MIKDLITDLANSNIKLSEALTRSKLIAFKINNDTFKAWIKKEIEGYQLQDQMLPAYRKIYSEITLIAQFVGGEEREIPFQLPEDTHQNVLDTIHFHEIREPISIVEVQIGNDDKPQAGRITLPTPMMEMIKSTLPKALLMQIKMGGGVIDKLQRDVNTIQYNNVIDQTKNKLLDILLELEAEFPNLENDYVMNDDNNSKANNIITNNIYGTNTPINIATGDNANQTNIITHESIDYEKLKSLEVDDKEIEDLKVIVEESKGDKSIFSQKILGWISSVTSSLTAKGLYDNIPAITEYLQTLM